jgi:hypothetical protein
MCFGNHQFCTIIRKKRIVSSCLSLPCWSQLVWVVSFSLFEPSCDVLLQYSCPSPGHHAVCIFVPLWLSSLPHCHCWGKWYPSQTLRQPREASHRQSPTWSLVRRLPCKCGVASVPLRMSFEHRKHYHLFFKYYYSSC